MSSTDLAIIGEGNTPALRAAAPTLTQAEYNDRLEAARAAWITENSDEIDYAVHRAEREHAAAVRRMDAQEQRVAELAQTLEERAEHNPSVAADVALHGADYLARREMGFFDLPPINIEPVPSRAELAERAARDAVTDQTLVTAARAALPPGPNEGMPNRVRRVDAAVREFYALARHTRITTVAPRASSRESMYHPERFAKGHDLVYPIQLHACQNCGTALWHWWAKGNYANKCPEAYRADCDDRAMLRSTLALAQMYYAQGDAELAARILNDLPALREWLADA